MQTKTTVFQKKLIVSCWKFKFQLLIIVWHFSVLFILVLYLLYYVQFTKTLASNLMRAVFGQLSSLSWNLFWIINCATILSHHNLFHKSMHKTFLCLERKPKIFGKRCTEKRIKIYLKICNKFVENFVE